MTNYTPPDSPIPLVTILAPGQPPQFMTVDAWNEMHAQYAALTFWSKKTPTEPGVYWAVDVVDETIRAVEVSEFGLFHLGDEVDKDASRYSHWIGPIPQPGPPSPEPDPREYVTGELAQA